MTRHKNVDWNLPDVDENNKVRDGIVTNALLMDIRDELKQARVWLGMIKDTNQQLLRYQRRIDARLAKTMPLPRGKKYE